MTIDKAKLKQLLSAQVSLHKVAKETGTIEDENVYLNADDALNEYLDDRGIYIEDVALALLAEIERLAKFEDWFIRLDQVEQSLSASFKAERDQLKAENSRLRTDIESWRLTVEAERNINRVTGDELERLKGPGFDAELAALRKDALRYRWLRDGCGVVEYKAIAGSIGPGMLPSGDKLQAAIDAAMAKEAPHG